MAPRGSASQFLIKLSTDLSNIEFYNENPFRESHFRYSFSDNSNLNGQQTNCTNDRSYDELRNWSDREIVLSFSRLSHAISTFTFARLSVLYVFEYELAQPSHAQCLDNSDRWETQACLVLYMRYNFFVYFTSIFFSVIFFLLPCRASYTTTRKWACSLFNSVLVVFWLSRNLFALLRLDLKIYAVRAEKKVRGEISGFALWKFVEQSTVRSLNFLPRRFVELQR